MEIHVHYESPTNSWDMSMGVEYRIPENGLISAFVVSDQETEEIDKDIKLESFLIINNKTTKDRRVYHIDKDLTMIHINKNHVIELESS